MKFEWDEDKRLKNIQRHGIDFVGIEEAFDGLTLTLLDDRFDYGEIRLVTFALLNGVVIVIVHTETKEKIRLISVRKATKNEEKEYYKNIAD